MRTVGEILHEQRRQTGKSISKIAVKLKIREGYLSSLERDEYGAIPGGMPIVQGIVRRYAQFLGLDSQKLIAILRRDFVIPRAPKITPHKIERRSFFFWTPRHTLLAVVAILIFFLLFFLFENFSNSVAAPKIQISSPREGEEIPAEQVVVKGKVKRADVVMINGQSVTVAENGAFRGSFSCDKGENIFLIEAISPRGKKTQIERHFVCR